jgi:phosphate transport system permease protein
MDALGALVIRAGGMLVIAAVLLILVFIGREALPLFLPAHASEGARGDAVFPAELKCAGLDPTESRLYGVGADGRLLLARMDGGRVMAAVPMGFPGLETGAVVTAACRVPGRDTIVAGTTNGRVVVARLDFEKGEEIRAAGAAELRGGAAVTVVCARQGEDGLIFAAADAAGRLWTGLMEGDEVEIEAVPVPAGSARIVSLVCDDEPDLLVALLEDGTVLHWQLARTRKKPFVTYPVDGGRRRTAMEAVIGDGQLLMGHDDGTIELWSLVRHGAPPGGRRFLSIRRLLSPGGAVSAIRAAEHSRDYLAAGGSRIVCGYTTSGKGLRVGTTTAPVLVLAYGPKRSTVAGIDASGAVVAWRLRNPHPEVTGDTLFGKVWYEGFDQPMWSWQSSSGSDSFESKYSLTPLVVGTLKGAFYGLLFAVPIAVLGALYTSQFLDATSRRWVKPTVELMAAMPSVVVGFIAGLWLAPLLEDHVISLLIAPLIVMSGALLAGRIAQTRFGAWMRGNDLWVVTGSTLAALVISWSLGPAIEHVIFGEWIPAWTGAPAGTLKDAVFRWTGVAFEQRNSVVIGVALGFAVVPIIYTISEDAMANVPRSLVSGSMALGASRWQTAVRVVLPTASPGVFSAAMIGLGRAVGETMIVLMATGNTPVMGFSPFNGMRTLSANIAVEVPEAPVGSTHYRILFLSALILFVITFAINSVADYVRQNLRKRYESG